MRYEVLAKNPLSARDDLKTALLYILRPYEKHFTPGSAGIDLGPPGATFSERATRVEGFARLLWGIVPLVAGGGEYAGLDRMLEGITNGVDPAHPEYWGEPGDYDQRLVEMAVFGYALLLAPDRFWLPLSEITRARLSAWLLFINTRKIPDCNWVFFRILVNAGLEKVGAPGWDREQLSQSLEIVERFYLEDGWYNDGFPEARRARDYYIPWAMHYYGLIFAYCCKTEYPEIAARYRERAKLFSAQFQSWFTPEGEALPFGRSLTYRYAQAAFWGGLALAAESREYACAVDWGTVKGIFLRNLRFWFRKPFFTETGIQTVGYAYPNQYLAERYNSPCSPLWALKAFIPLAVSEKNPFWSAEEKPLPARDEYSAQPAAGFIINNGRVSGHVHALSAGQWTPGESNEHVHMAEKYAKFAYSCAFGFNVAVDCYGLDKAGHDNSLVLAEEGRWFRFRTQTRDHEVTGSHLFSRWSPFPWMEVETWIVPHGAWHIRLHRIVADRHFSSAEGGFALAYDDSGRPDEAALKQPASHQAAHATAFGYSRIVDLFGERSGSVVISSPNSNILYSHTMIPTLSGTYGAVGAVDGDEPGNIRGQPVNETELPPGAAISRAAETGRTRREFWLGCAVLACPDPLRGKDLAAESPFLLTRAITQNILSSLPADVRNKITEHLSK